MRPRILLTDPEVHIDNVRDELEAVADLVRCENNDAETLTAAAADVDLIIVSCFTKIPAAVIENAGRLKAVLKYGVGVDNIDLSAATRKGILVVNCPEYGSNTIAEHAFALMIGLAKKLVRIDKLTREKLWLWPEIELMGTELQEKTIGLIGFGRIGSQMARMTAGFGMRPVAYDPYVPEDQIKAGQARPVGLEELLKSSDMVSIHCVLTPETKKLIGAAELAKMKPSAFLIDVSRGAIIDEAALTKALQEKRIAGAGLDVFPEEPLKADNPLLKMENVILTPHMAWYTREAYDRLAQETLQRVLEILDGKIPYNLKNPEVIKTRGA
jgi:D-3-phosphoglycerate dehydrogenase